MLTRRISIIAAIGLRGELGKNNALIWRIPNDLKRFKELTMGHPIVMGRKTYESIGRALPGRTNIVVSKSAGSIPGCITVDSFHHALAVAEDIDRKEIFIIGGAAIYEAAMLHANRLYLTLIHAKDPDADVYFPEYRDFTKVVERTTLSEGALAYEWLTLERAT